MTTKGTSIAVKAGDTVNLTFTMKEGDEKTVEQYKRTVELKVDDVNGKLALLTVQKAGATITGHSIERLRQLRLWHWREARSYRGEQQAYEAAQRIARSQSYKDRYDKLIDDAKSCADMHTGFVQTLNDFFEIGDSAEKDDAK